MYENERAKSQRRTSDLPSRRQAAPLSEGAARDQRLPDAGTPFATTAGLTLLPSNPGFEARDRLVMRVDKSSRRPLPPHTAESLRELQERLAVVPRVRAVAAATDLPLTRLTSVLEAVPVGAAPEVAENRIRVHHRACSTNFFRTLDIPILKGRDFADTDREAAPRVAIINETLARRFWPDQEAVGRSMTLQSRTGPAVVQVVGIARDMRIFWSHTEARPEVYVPLSQAPGRRLALVIHTAGDPLASVASIRSAIRDYDPELAVNRVQSMEQMLYDSVGLPRFHGLLLGSLAGLALLLAIVGIYGVLSHSVSRRVRELGLRSALGAQRRDLLRLVMAQALGPISLGLAAGLGAALGLTRLIAGELHEVSPTDPATLAAAALLLAAVAMAACYIPARRATRIDPMAALRDE